MKNLVLSKHRGNKNRVVNVGELIEKYTAFNCPGVVALIEFLESDKDKDVLQIGSGTIDLSDDGVDEYFSRIMNGGNTCGLYIGEPNIGLTPLQWLAYLADELSEVIPEQIRAFDEICEELVMAHTAPTYPIGYLEV